MLNRDASKIRIDAALGHTRWTPHLAAGGRFFLLAALVGALTACDPSSTDEPAPPPDSESTTHTFAADPAWTADGSVQRSDPMVVPDDGVVQLDAASAKRLSTASRAPGPASHKSGTALGSPLRFVDQLGGDVRMLGSRDRDLILSVGGRIHRLAVPGGLDLPAIASSDPLPGMPLAYAALGDLDLIATTDGVSFLRQRRDRYEELGHFPLGETKGIAIYGDRAYAISDGGQETELAVLKIDGSTQPQLESIWALPGRVESIAIKDGIAFTAGGRHELRVLDLRQADAPRMLLTGTWPWSQRGEDAWPSSLSLQDGQLLVLQPPGSNEEDRRCLFVFALDDALRPRLRQTQSCVYGSVQWYQVVGSHILMRRDETVDVFLLGDENYQETLSNVVGSKQQNSISRTTAARVGSEIIQAPVADYGNWSHLDALRISVFGQGRMTWNFFSGPFKGVQRFESVSSDGDRLAAISPGSAVSDSRIELLRWNGLGLLERIGRPMESQVDRVLLRGDTLITSRDADLNLYEIDDSRTIPLRQVGVLQPAFEHCRNVETVFRGPNCRPGPMQSLDLWGELLLASPGWPATAPLEGPLVYQVADSARPALLGALDMERPWQSQTNDGLALSEPIALRMTYHFDSDASNYGEAYQRTWIEPFEDRVLLIERDRVTLRESHAAFVATALYTLPLPGIMPMAARIEREGQRLIVAGAASPSVYASYEDELLDAPRQGPGLYVIAVEAGGLPKVLGFVALPTQPRDISTAGEHVFVAAEGGGLMVFDLADPLPILDHDHAGQDPASAAGDDQPGGAGPSS
jgi:hypothetical protein